MTGYSAKDVVIEAGKSVGNSETDTVISKRFRVGFDHSTQLKVRAELSGISGTGTVLNIRHSPDGENFTTIKTSSAITGSDTIFEFDFVPADGQIWSLVEITATTGGSDAITVDKLWVSRG